MAHSLLSNNASGNPAVNTDSGSAAVMTQDNFTSIYTYNMGKYAPTLDSIFGCVMGVDE